MAKAVLPQGLPKQVSQRINEVLVGFEELYPEDIAVVFASTSDAHGANEAEDRHFDSLWLFTEQYIGEVRNLQAGGQRVNFDIARLARNVDYIRISSRDFDIKKATADSWMELEFTTSDGLSGSLRSLGVACDDLLKIYQDYFKANLVEKRK